MVASPETRQQRRVLGASCTIHFIHDGFSDLVTLLQPIWRAERPEWRTPYPGPGPIESAGGG